MREPRSEAAPQGVQARRRRVTSRFVMSGLAVCAVALTAGGVIGPQIVYAIEANRFGDLAQRVDDTASEVEGLEASSRAESLLWQLRSDEASKLSQKLAKLAARTADPALRLSLEEAAGAVTAVVSTAKHTADTTALTQRAVSARNAQTPDPNSWFDVSTDALVEYAAIDPELLERADSEGTVTRERVAAAEKSLKSYRSTADHYETELQVAAAKNTKLNEGVASAAETVTAESLRVSTDALSALEAAAANEALATLPEAEPLRAAATELQLAASIQQFAVDQAGTIVGVPVGAALPSGALVIPGGDSIRIAYVTTRLDSFVSARLAYQAAVAAANEQAAAENDDSSSTSSEGNGGDGTDGGGAGDDGTTEQPPVVEEPGTPPPPSEPPTI